MLPLPDLPDAYMPPRPLRPHERGERVVSPPAVREQIISHLAEKYVDMAIAPDPPPAKGDIESQFAIIKTQATDLLMNLERLKTPAVAALNLAIGEGSYPPPRRVAFSTAAMVIDRRPKVLGDIMGRLEVLIDAVSRAEVPMAKDVRGRHRNSNALEIAKAAASDYSCLTCESPSRSYKSGFAEFLAAIFKALGMGHSVETYARQACEWWKAPSVTELSTDDDSVLDAILAGIHSGADKS